MNPGHLHLILNHVPLLGVIAGTALLMIAEWRQKEEWIRIGLGTLVLTAVIAIPVYFTGEPAEDMVEHIPEVSGPYIEAHEAAAGWALASILLLGCIALAAIIFFGRYYGSRLARYGLLAFALMSCGIIARTANLGGKIHHSELRSGDAPPPGKTKDDDD